MRTHRLIAAMLTMLLGATAPGAEPRSPTATALTRPNIVYILADDLGYGDVGCFNPHSKIPTPNMDRLAREGMRFTDAHSASAVCTPTRYGLLTGRYAWRTRLKRGVLWTTSPHLIEPGQMTVASLLAAHGYDTACIGKWHLGMDWPERPAAGDTEPGVDFAQPVRHGPRDVGFDEFFGIPASLDMSPYFWVENDRVVALPTERIDAVGGLSFWRAGGIAPGFAHVDVLPEITRRAVAYIDRRARRQATQPFFLYLPLTAPHTPVVPNEAFRGRSAAGPYGDFVIEVDWTVGRVLEALTRAGLAEGTLVIVTSDNGSTMTLAATAEYGHAANHVFRGRKSDIWEGGHRVPFIARWPRLVPAGAEQNEPISLNDLLATCAEVVGETLPENAGEDSVSMVPLLAGHAERPRPARAIVHHSIDGVFAVREGPWKLILARGSGGWSLPEKQVAADVPPGQLYNLDDDPQEAHNLYDDEPEVVSRLRANLERIRGGD